MRTTTFGHRARFFLAVLLLAAAGQASAAVTDSFVATYDVDYGFIGLGTITFELEPSEQANCYVYSGQGQPNAIVSMLIGRLSDESHFCLTRQNTLRPHYFRHHEEGAPEDSYTLHFNWDAHTVRYQNRNGNFQTLSLPDKVTDPLSLQIAARMWLANSPKPAELTERGFTLVDGNEIKTYTLAVKPGGTINVPAGRYDTLVVERVDDNDKHLRFWLAEYADWIPVRVEHERDGRTVTMEMTSIAHK